MKFILAILFLLSAACLVHGQTLIIPPQAPAPAVHHTITVTYPQKEEKYYVPVIVFDGPVDDSSSNEFVEQFNKLAESGPDSILVEITTYGGGVDAGWRMARAIERSTVKVVCVAENEVASMGVFILESCPIRVQTSRSFLTAHYPYYPTVSTTSSKDFDNLIQRNIGMKDSMLVQVYKRTKLTKGMVKAKLDVGDWVILADVALDIGMVDYVADSVEQIQKSLETQDKIVTK